MQAGLRETKMDHSGCICVTLAPESAGSAAQKCSLVLNVVQTFGFSKEFTFLSAPKTGPNSTIHFLAIADLGHTELDGSEEYDYDEGDDPLNFVATGTMERVSTCRRLSNIVKAHINKI